MQTTNRRWFVVRSIKILTALLALSCIVAWQPVNAKSPSLTKEESQQKLADCIANTHELSVLFLVDQSLSLRDSRDGKSKGSDSDNRRVDGMKAAIAGLDLSSSIDKETKINVAFIGFGNGVYKPSNWIKIGDIDQLNVEAEKFAKLNGDNGTNYIAGLDGSLKELSKRRDEIDSASCALLIWLTDGGFDIDGKNQLSGSEIRRLEKEMCGENRVVDRLREIGTTIVGIGLSGENEPDFSWVQKVVGDKSGCGRNEANGWFIHVENADSLVDELFKGVTDPSSSPRPLSGAKPCSGKPTNCAEIAFNVGEFVTKFNILVQPTVPVGDTKYEGSVSLIAPKNARTVKLLPESDDIESVQIRKFFATRALVRVDLSKEASEDRVGEWLIRFEGEDALSSKALAVFLSDFTATLADDQKSIIDRVDSKLNPIKLQIGWSQFPDAANSGSSVSAPKLEAELIANGRRWPLEVVETSSSKFEITRASLKTLFDDRESEASVASAGVLELTPVLEVDGLSIKFVSSRVAVTFRDGEMYPSVSGPDRVRIDKHETATINLKIVGPQQGDGVVRIEKEVSGVVGGSDSANSGSFTLSNVPDECRVKQGEETSCSFDISADFQANAEFNLEIPIVIESSSKSDGSKKQKLNVLIEMTKPINQSKSIVAAAELFALFVLVQLLLRFGFAYFMSRFEPLPEGSRRTIANVKLAADGRITAKDGSVFRVKNEDAELVHDMSEPFRSIRVGNFSFSVSLLHTFRTQKVVGRVSVDGSEVFGSLGQIRRPKYGIPGIGSIALTPRGQWAISVRPEDLRVLASDQGPVDVQLIAFFDEIQRTPLDQQVMSLQVEIATSRFAEDLNGHFDSIKNSIQNEIVPESDKPTLDERLVGTSDDPLGSGNSNPLGDHARVNLKIDSNPNDPLN